MTKKYVTVLSFCAVFLFAIICCCVFVLNENVIAFAQVTGDITNGTYTVGYTTSSVTNSSSRYSINIGTLDLYDNGGLYLSFTPSFAQSISNDYQLVFYRYQYEQIGQARVVIKRNTIDYATYSAANSSWTTVKTGLTIAPVTVTVTNCGVTNTALLNSLKIVLTPSITYFTAGSRYMLSYDFTFSSSDVITLGPCYISLFDNVDYVVYGSSYNIFSFNYITPSMAEFIINYDNDLDNRYVAVHWQQNDFIDRYVRVYPNGKMYIDLNGDIYQGYFDSSQFYIVPQDDNFSDVPSSSDLSLLDDGLVDWSNFLNNAIGYTYSSSVVPYPVFNSGETYFEYEYVPFISLSLLDEGTFLNTYTVDLSFDNDCYGVVSTADFGNGVIYSNVVRGSLLDPQVTSIGYSYSFGNSLNTLPVNYTYYLVYYDSDVYDPYLPVVRKQFRTRSYNQFWELNYQNTLGNNSFFTDYTNAVYQYYDKSSLVSVMFAVPDVVKSILVGTYDANSNSYVNGLLTFEILGINLRDFFLSIITIIVLLKIVSFIIGRFGVA